jgi:DNA-binding PadR family transcriptional regulator
MSVRHAVLGLLAQHPRHGYELRAAFQALVGGEKNWDVKPAQIYTTLARLEQGGLVVEDGVEQDAGPEKRIFALTPPGRQALQEWFASGIEPEHQHDEFFLKLMIGLVSGVADPYRLIHTQRMHLYQELHNLTEQRSEADPGRELANILLFDKSIMHVEADIRWLDMIEARLDDIRRQPLPEPDAKPRGRPKKIWDLPGQSTTSNR